ncbi:MAG: aacA-aphD [Alphaproteobacteria bacterium]|nr:aacA-aphD [Alphaproteobacteria bacterium]
MEQDRNVNQDKERSEPLQSVDPAILEEAVDILSKRFLAPIQIKSVQFLSEPERRNVLLRITLEDSPNGVPTSVILKQALPQESSKEDKEALGRFARDWAGLGFLNALNSPIVPKVYGGSHTHRFILLADLGEVHLSLVDSLMGTDQEAALEALTRFAQTMGQLHADAYGHTDSYKKLLKSLDPQTNYWPDYLEDMVSKRRL